MEGKEALIIMKSCHGETKGIIEKIDEKGVTIIQNKKHIFIPIHNISYIEWKEKKQQKLDNWIKEEK